MNASLKSLKDADAKPQRQSNEKGNRKFNKWFITIIGEAVVTVLGNYYLMLIIALLTGKQD